MNILGQAKSIAGKVTDFSSDEIIANTIIKAMNKQEKVNVVLKAKGSNYRVSDTVLEMGIPPTISFIVRRVHGGTKKVQNELQLNTGESVES